jgi:hypothetical protein
MSRSWRQRAEEARKVAEQMNDAQSGEAILRIAKDYERLAKRAEERTKRTPQSNGPTTVSRGLVPEDFRRTPAIIFGLEITQKIRTADHSFFYRDQLRSAIFRSRLAFAKSAQFPKANSFRAG